MLGCELPAGTAARPADPAGTEGWVTLPKAGDTGGSKMSLLAGSNDPNYLPQISLAAKKSAFFTALSQKPGILKPKKSYEKEDSRYLK